VHAEHQRIGDLFSKAARGGGAEPGAVAEAVAHMRHHFRYEEDKLFPLVRKVLTPGHLDQLGRSWAEAREFRTGSGNGKGTGQA
jgi:hypothetical protein